MSASQSGFANRLLATLAKTAPGVNPQLVIRTGATQIRSSFTPGEVPGILEAYMAGIKVTMAIATGLAGASVLVTLFVSRKRLNVQKLQGGAA